MCKWVDVCGSGVPKLLAELVVTNEKHVSYNCKVKRVASRFTRAEDLDIILAEPVRHLKNRLADSDPEPHELDPLYDRICAEQSSLGA